MRSDLKETGKFTSYSSYSQEGLITTMLQPCFYPRRPSEVTHLETHISHLFFAGDLVYKVKKPVRFSFLDYSTLAKRRYYIHEEVRLNRRLAPSVYLGVLPISYENHGWQLGSDANPVEYTLIMRRLPARRMLDFLLERGLVTPEMLRSLAQIMASFHAEAATSEKISAGGHPDTIQKLWEENLEDIQPFVGSLLDSDSFGALHDFGKRFLNEHKDLLLRRVQEGRIREVHGDLHCEHICFAPEGIQIFDCVEFSRRLRCCDVASETAFLVMDMESRGAGELGREFLRRYLELTEDRELPHLLTFYKCHRALVRGKVFGLQLVEMSEMAERYFDLAYSYTWDEFKPFLVLVCGLTGSGKSTLARALSRRLGLPVVSSDATRKALAGTAERHEQLSYGEGIYSTAMTERTYSAMAEQAEEYIIHGQGAILDATFQQAAQRAAIMSLAERKGVPLVAIHCYAPEKLTQERLRRRAEEGSDISDGRWEIYAAQKEAFEPPTEFPTLSYLFLDTEPPPAELASKVESFLLSALKRRS